MTYNTNTIQMAKWTYNDLMMIQLQFYEMARWIESWKYISYLENIRFSQQINLEEK